MQVLVRGSLAKVTGGSVSFLRRILQCKNPKYYWEKRSDPNAQPVICFVDVAEKTFPAGFIEYARPKLLKKGIDIDARYRVEGWRQDVDPNCLNGKTLRPYQIEAIKLALLRVRATLECATGCHAKGQGVLLFSGAVKPVEDVVIGDVLMGPDSKPRKVLKLIRGSGARMVRVVPVKGDPFIVNEDHVLSLQLTGAGAAPNGRIVDVSVKDWEKWSKKKKHTFKLFRSEAVNSWGSYVSVDPYAIGALLGDGSLGEGGCPKITSADTEVVSYFREFAKHFGCVLSEDVQLGSASVTYRITHWSHSRAKSNRCTDALKEAGIWGMRCHAKRVPLKYRTSALTDRLELLAGLIDTDGSLHNGGYDFVSKSRMLANDTAFLARSVGLAAYVRRCRKSCQTGAVGTYWRVGISGNCSIIPCRIPRKSASPRVQKKSVLRTGFSIQEAGIGDYYGFTLCGDGRYLLDDFTVTHNSGKTAIVSGICHYLLQRSVDPILLIVPTVSLLHQTRRDLEEMLGTKVGMIGDGKKQYDCQITVAIPDTLRKAVRSPDSWNRKYRRMMPGKLADPKMAAYLKSVKALIVDECHHAGSDTWRQLSMACPADVRLGVTGTADKKEDGRVGLEYFKLMSVTGPIIMRVESKELINSGVLAKPTIFRMADRGIFGKHVKSYTGNMEKPNPRFPRMWAPKRELRPWNTIYTEAVTGNNRLNRYIALITKKLIQLGSPPLIFCNHERHLANLVPHMKKVGVKFRPITGKTPVQVREQYLQQFVAKNDFAVGATPWMDEGVDVPQIKALIMASGGKSRVKFIQRIGRALRRKKSGDNVAIVIDFAHSNNPHTFRHSVQRKEECKRQKWDTVVCKDISKILTTRYLIERSRPT